MATISLYKNKINGVGGLIDSIVKSSNKLDTQLGTLRNTLQGVDSSTCNLQSVVSSISSSSKSEKEKVADLKRLNSKLTDFITMTARRDADAKSAVERSKNDFYSKYSYLKPECEKNVFEHICDGIATATKWCKEHWKLIVTAIIVVVAVVLICTGVGGILGAMALGALLGALIGGGVGGTLSVINGGSFLDGFEEGAFSGAIAGIITGGLGFSLSAGGTVALSLGQTMGIGGISSAGASLFGDVGDVLLLGKNLSISQIFMNMTIAGLTGAAFAGISYGISKGISALKLKIKGNVKPIENGPYVKNGKPHGRPGPTGKEKLEFEKAVYNKCVDKNGVLRDPNTGQVLDWKPGEPRAGKVDFGHKPGKNYQKVFEQYRNGKISLQELKAYQSNPKNFRIEAYSANRSHAYERTFYERTFGDAFKSTKGAPWSSAIVHKEVNNANQ